MAAVISVIATANGKETDDSPVLFSFSRAGEGAAEQDILRKLLPEWHLLLKKWAANGRLTAAAQEALLLNGEPKALTDLTNQWAVGEFSALPPIVLLSSEDINGALGAYAVSTGSIYLNADWLLSASKEQVIAVLAEELGHHLDGVLNEVDTSGDEGEYFSRLLTNSELTASEVSALHQQNDAGTVMVQGQLLAAENAIDLTPPRPGGNSPETSTGTTGDDLIDGFGGDDTISGLAGDDILIGGDGNDIIDGGTGKNRLYGDAGNDTITSSGAGDVVDAGDGNNNIVITGTAAGGSYTSSSGIDAYTIQTGATGTYSITSGAGNDSFTIQYGTTESITINAGDGLNSIIASSKIYRFESGSGNDVVNLTAVGSSVFTGGGDDTITATGKIGNFQSNGEISAGDGNDTITLSGGDSLYASRIQGGDGSDIIILAGNANYAHVYRNIFYAGGFYGPVGYDTNNADGNDIIDASNAGNVFSIHAGAGDDTVTGTATRDFIYGATGNDLIDAGNGDNFAYGEEGNDNITAGSGNDNLYGGNGIDAISSGDGADNLFGEAGNDSLNGGSGYDIL